MYESIFVIKKNGITVLIFHLVGHTKDKNALRVFSVELYILFPIVYEN